MLKEEVSVPDHMGLGCCRVWGFLCKVCFSPDQWDLQGDGRNQGGGSGGGGWCRGHSPFMSLIAWRKKLFSWIWSRCSCTPAYPRRQPGKQAERRVMSVPDYGSGSVDSTLLVELHQKGERGTDDPAAVFTILLSWCCSQILNQEVRLEDRMLSMYLMWLLWETVLINPLILNPDLYHGLSSLLSQVIRSDTSDTRDI